MVDEDFDQDEVMFPIKLSAHLVELLKSLPRTVNPYRNDVEALTRLGFAVSVRHKNFVSLKRTDAGVHYLKSIGEYGTG